MGKINQGILGGFRGKVGNVVGFFWKGKAIMRGLAGSVGNPQTGLQMAVRYAFKKLIQLAAPMSTLLAETFRKTAEARKITGGNAFTSANYGSAAVPDTLDPQNPQMDYTKLIVAPQVGSGVNVSSPGAVQGAGSTLDISWTDNSGIAPDVMSRDAVGAVLLVPSLNRATFDISTAVRGDETLTIAYPNIYSGETGYVYLFTRSVDKENQSISTMIGSLTLA